MDFAQQIPTFSFRISLAFAVTVHNNSDALGEIRKVAQHYPEVGFVSGAELTACTPYGQLDLVCLGLPLEPTPEFAEYQITAEQNCGQEPVLVNCMKIMRIIRSSLNLCGTAFLRRYSCSGSAPGFRPQR